MYSAARQSFKLREISIVNEEGVFILTFYLNCFSHENSTIEQSTVAPGRILTGAAKPQISLASRAPELTSGIASQLIQGRNLIKSYCFPQQWSE